MTLQQLRVCAISTFWSALSFSFYFARRVFLCVIILFTSAIWVQNDHEPPKGWKIDEENNAERREKMCTINLHHVHIIFCVQTVFIYFQIVVYYLYTCFHCLIAILFFFFLTWKYSLGILIWDITRHDCPHSNEWKFFI